MYELKPCPFCGGDAKHVWVRDIVYVRCQSCCANGKAFIGIDDATEAWNRRYTDEN